VEDDFIKELSEEEKVVFLKIFCRLIKSDGNVDASEIQFLKAVAARYGLDNNLVVEIIKKVSSVNYIAEAQKITNRKHALQLIKELCVLANIDELFDDAELDILIDVAQAMNVEEDKVVQINRWVLNNFVLQKVGKIILETDDD